MTLDEHSQAGALASGGVAQLRALHDLGSAVAAATTIESIYDAAIEVLQRSLFADRAAVLLFDPDGVMRFKASRGLSEGYRQLAEGHSPWSRDARSPEPIVITDVAADQSLGSLRDVVVAEGIGALAFVPLLYGDRLLGKFMVYYDAPRVWRPEAVALAITVAGHIAFALERRRLEEQLRTTAEQLSTTLNAVSEGITVQALDGSLLLANEAAASMLGFSSPTELLAAPVADIAGRFEVFDEHGDALPLDRLPGRAALRGEEPAEMLVRWRIPSSGAEHVSLVNARPARDDRGSVRFAVNVFRDVTERQQATEALRASEARLTFLAMASRRLLASSLEPLAVLELAADLVVPQLADWCSVREIGDDGRVERVATRHSGGDQAAELVRRLSAYGDPLIGDPALDQLRAGHGLTVEMTPELLVGLAQDDEHHDVLRQLGLHSVMLVPLRAAGRTIGVLTLGAQPQRDAYTEADLDLAEEFAARVAATVMNARSYAHEHATAKALARALLPGKLPEIPGLQLATRYRAAGLVGGDFYDCFPTGPERWMVVVGDVCGRGIQAASMTGLTRHTIRAAALHASSPAQVLVDLNRLLLDAAAEEMAAWFSHDSDSGPSFCTVCIAEVTRSAGGARAVVSSGGHPLPRVVRSDGSVVEFGRPGSLVGLVEDFQVSEETVELNPGDALVLFTDGITERRRKGRLLEQDMEQILAATAGSSADHVAGHLEDCAVSYALSAPDDDIAVVVVAVPSVHGSAAMERDQPHDC